MQSDVECSHYVLKEDFQIFLNHDLYEEFLISLGSSFHSFAPH